MGSMVAVIGSIYLSAMDRKLDEGRGQRDGPIVDVALNRSSEPGRKPPLEWDSVPGMVLVPGPSHLCAASLQGGETHRRRLS